MEQNYAANISTHTEAIIIKAKNELVDCESEKETKLCERLFEERCSVREYTSENHSCISVNSDYESEGQSQCFEPENKSVLITCSHESVVCSTEPTRLHSDPCAFGAVKVSNSKQVVVGNVTYLTGAIHVTQTSSAVSQILSEDAADEQQQSDKLFIISRRDWLARPVLDRIRLVKPVRYVIIAHTATEEGFSDNDNNHLIKLIQGFHIDSRKFVDISYNFLIGATGSVYEGRGWDLQGEHTHGYNNVSVAISFIGCFMDHLPTCTALQAVKKLIHHGIQIGVIPEDYVLIGHCQCLPIESPGRKLFEEIKTWSRWRELTSADI